MQPTVRKKEMKLPVKMSDEEYIEKARELVDWQRSISDSKEQIKDLSDALKPGIKMAEEKVENISLDLKNNYVIRGVPVYEIFDWDRGVVYVRRCDTDEIVKGQFRKISDEEKQTHMNIDDSEEVADQKLLPSPEEVKEIEAEVVDSNFEEDAQDDDLLTA